MSRSGARASVTSLASFSFQTCQRAGRVSNTTRPISPSRTRLTMASTSANQPRRSGLRNEVRRSSSTRSESCSSSRLVAQSRSGSSLTISTDVSSGASNSPSPRCMSRSRWARSVDLPPFQRPESSVIAPRAMKPGQIQSGGSESPSSLRGTTSNAGNSFRSPRVLGD